MGKLEGHLFFTLFAWLALLLSIEVSRASEAPRNFMNVLRSDDNLCKIPEQFLYNSSLADKCRSVNFPSEPLPLNHKNSNTFTCLVIYDTAYRLCNYSSHWHSSFNNATAFDSYIEKFAPAKEDQEQKEAFCKSIQGITPIYEKTKILVSPMFDYINDIKNCVSYCFALPGLPDPLCTMFAWIKKTDEDVHKSMLIKPLSNEEQKNKNPIEPNLEKPVQEAVNDKPKEVETINQESKPPKPETNPAETKLENLNNDIHPAVDTRHETNVAQNSATDPQDHKSENAEVPPEVAEPVNPNNDHSQKVHPALSPVDDIVVDVNKKEDEKIDKNSLGNEDKTKEIGPVSNENIKTSTISQNTQDHPELEDNHLNGAYDPDDADQSIDPSDQNQNLMEPPEPRENIPRRHSIIPEEESHFFAYFTVVSLLCIAAYIGYHNKQKILAIAVEGRRRNSRSRRRPSTASYRKLDCTLEEAVTSQCNANVTHVIY